jgi:O-antigen/teichoic acid export membrane protein
MLTTIKARLEELTQNIGFKRYLFNTLWMFSDHVFRLVAGVVVGIWVARYLGPDQFGIFNYAIAFVAIFGVIAKLGLDSLVVKEVVHTPEQSDAYMGTAFWLKTGGAALTVVAGLGYIFFSDEPDATRFYIFLLTLGLFFQAFEVVDFYFQAKVLSKFVSICKNVQLAISCAVKLYLVYIKADLLAFIAVQFLDQVTLGLTQLLVYRIYSGRLAFLKQFNKRMAHELLRNSWPLVLGSVVIMIYMRIDQIMIMKMVGEREMGIFSAAVRLSEAWYFVPVVITNSLFPAIVNAKKVSETEYRQRLQRLFNFMVWISLAVAIMVTFLSPFLVTMLFGEPYAGAARILSIHVWAGVFVCLGVASTGWFLSENLQQFGLLKSVLGVCLNVVLNFILIPVYGAVGSAIATISCQIVVSFLLNAFHPRAREIFKMQLRALMLFKISG